PTANFAGAFSFWDMFTLLLSFNLVQYDGWASHFSGHVIPSPFIAAVIGSEKNTGSTRSTMSPETSRKFRLFSRGINARRAPLSMPTWSGSARDRTALMFPWMLMVRVLLG